MPLPPSGPDHANFEAVDQIEVDMSKYTLNEDNTIFHESSVSPSSPTVSSPDGSQYNTDALPIGNGLIHGHVHNFDNFTYIHGHIHTNDSLFDPLTYAQQTLASPPEHKQNRTLRRRSSYHRHLNDLHSAQFTDCQHFEFLNCHDQQSKPVIVEDPNITCEEDENCKPKILEICCDNTHGHDDSFTPLFPDAPGLPKNQHQHPHTHDHSSSFAHQGDDKTFEDCNFDDCIDVKCDLDTCDIDELYCKYCENLDDFPDIKASIQNGNSVTKAIDQSHTHCETHSHDHSISGQSQSLSNNSLTQLIGSSLPYTQRVKREREDDDSTKPPNVLHHHLHHHTHHAHPENHHHHHIQLHDHHHDKKIKSESAPSNSLINFEWNFKNQQAKCEWDSCSSMFDNTLLLQTHIVENHLVPEFDIHNIISDGPGPDDSQPYECEWKNCDYTGDGVPALLSHINSQHSGYPSEDKLSLPQSKNLLTPSPDHQVNGDIYVGGDDEETTCKWIMINEDGSTHLCGHEFANAEDLTNHLVESHVGSGQGMYFCMWENCDREGTGFKQRQKALRHLHTHTHYKPLKCDVCGRRFAVDTMLKQHMRTHSGEKPYKCTMCDKRFATSSSLSVHLRTHTGEKPLVCKYPGCGKRFSESSNLTKHMKIHEKEFKCDSCLRSFATLKQLSSHNAKYHSGPE